MKSIFALTAIAAVTFVAAGNANAYGPYMLPDGPPVVVVTVPADDDVYAGPPQHGECGMGAFVRTTAAQPTPGR
jgi:hypothetical protein